MPPGDGPRVKICGVTRVADAELAVELGADFLGLNFYPASPRCLDLDAADRIAAAVAGRVRLVAVTVNAEPRRIEQILPLVDLVQFHGEEGPEAIRPWAERAIKVLRPEAGEAESAADYPDVWGFLLEPHRPGYGGSGKPWDYASAVRPVTARPVFLAGGITPDNVRAAAAGAWGIDVCSGVESKPGIKDPGRMQRLFSELRRS
jgi:phosphoribosylanthranilate isomerase